MVTICFNESLDIASVRVLHSQMVTAMAQAQPITLDVTRVERIDGSTLQLFVALFRAADENKLAIHWHGATTMVRDAARLLGVEQYLKLDNMAQ
jgi:anti-anti-sigma regulatory factor